MTEQSGDALSMLRNYCATRAGRRFHMNPRQDELIRLENTMVLEWVDDGIQVVRAALASPGAMEGAQAAQPEPSPELIELVKAARELCQYGQSDNGLRADLRRAGRAFYASVPLEWQRRFNGLDAAHPPTGEPT